MRHNAGLPEPVDALPGPIGSLREGAGNFLPGCRAAADRPGCRPATSSPGAMMADDDGWS
jgi:hypothetical protein